MCTPLLAIDGRTHQRRPVTLCYDPASFPMAIRLSIHQHDQWVEWAIDRATLADAQLRHVTGLDVSAQRMGPHFVLSLHPPGQRSMQLILDNEDVYTYLRWTWDQVPPCRDPRHCYDLRCVECNTMRATLDLDCDLFTLTTGEPE